MPRNATLDQRVVWHAEHARVCGCRPVPPAIEQELRRRGSTAPDFDLMP